MHGGMVLSLLSLSLTFSYPTQQLCLQSPLLAGSSDHPAFGGILATTLRVQAPTDGDMGPDILGTLET